MTRSLKEKYSLFFTKFWPAKCFLTSNQCFILVVTYWISGEAKDETKKARHSKCKISIVRFWQIPMSLPYASVGTQYVMYQLFCDQGRVTNSIHILKTAQYSQKHHSREKFNYSDGSFISNNILFSKLKSKTKELKKIFRKSAYRAILRKMVGGFT